MKTIFSLIILTTFNMFSQNINEYQYVIVPAKFEIFNEENKYDLNNYTKLFLEKYGFVVFMSNQDLPIELANNRCKAVSADLVKESNLLQTKVKLVLKDCQDKLVYETQIGKSREKDYATAYKQAFRDAAKSFETLNYKYSDSNKIIVTENPAVTNQVEPVSQVFKSVTTAVPVIGVPTHTIANGHFYAQSIENGFQLVNTEPKVIYKIYKTSVPDFFIAEKGEQRGVFFKKENSWYFEYYQLDKLYSENVGVKF